MAYNPTLGRWMQQDPMGYVDGMSLYQYCRNNPAVLTDPLGTYPQGFQGPRPMDNDPGPDSHRALYIDVVPEINPRAGDAEARAQEQAKGKEGKLSDSAIWWSAIYANYFSRSDVTLRTTSVENMISKIKSAVKHPDPTLKCGDAISRLVIRGHGSSGVVWLGYDSTSGTALIGRNIVPGRQFDGALVAQLRSLRGYFTKDAEIVLWSCRTGQDQLFLQQLANVTGVKVSGLTSDTTDHIRTLGWKGDWITVWPQSSTTVPAR